VLKKYGRHGSVSETNAVGRRWTKAVAMSTPVPKCCDMNTNRLGPADRLLDDRRDIKGNPQAKVLRTSMRIKAKT
jgi:hypothetical protein